MISFTIKFLPEKINAHLDLAEARFRKRHAIKYTTVISPQRFSSKRLYHFNFTNLAGNIDQYKARCLHLWTNFVVTLSVLNEISLQSVQFTSQSNIFLLFHRISEGISLAKAQVFLPGLFSQRKPG